MKSTLLAATFSLLATTFSFANAQIPSSFEGSSLSSASRVAENSNRQWHNNWSNQVSFATPEVRCYPIRRISMTDGALNDESRAADFQWIVDKAQSSLQLSLPHCLGEQGLKALEQQIQYEMAVNGYSSARVSRPSQDLHSGSVVFSLGEAEAHTAQLPQLTIENESTVVTEPVKTPAVEVVNESVNIAQNSVASAQKPAVVESTSQNSISTFANQTVQTSTIVNNSTFNEPVEQGLQEQQALEKVEISANNLTTDGEKNIQPIIAKTAEDRPTMRFNQRQIFGLSAYLGLNTHSSISNGQMQIHGGLDFDNVLSRNDLFSLSFSHALKLNDSPNKKSDRAFEFNYQIPYGNWTVDFSHKEERQYQHIYRKSNDSYIYNNKSKTDRIGVAYQIYNEQNHSVSVLASIWARKSKENGAEHSERTVGWKSGLAYDGVIAQSKLHFDIAFKQGKNRTIEANQQAEHLQIVSANFAWAQPFTIAKQAFQFKNELAMQWSNKSLSTQDQFTLDGVNSLKGFNSRYTLAGEKAWLNRSELAWKMKADKSLYIAFDAGNVASKVVQKQQKSKVATVAIGLKGEKKGLQYDVFVGKPVATPKAVKASKYVIGMNVNYRF